MFNSVYNVSIHHTYYYLRQLLCLWNTTLNRIESLRSDLIRIYRFANNLLWISDQWPQLIPPPNLQCLILNPHQSSLSSTSRAMQQCGQIVSAIHYITPQLNPDSWSVSEAYNNPRHEVRSDTVPLSISVITLFTYLCITPLLIVCLY